MKDTLIGNHLVKSRPSARGSGISLEYVCVDGAERSTTLTGFVLFFCLVFGWIVLEISLCIDIAAILSLGGLKLVAEQELSSMESLALASLGFSTGLSLSCISTSTSSALVTAVGACLTGILLLSGAS